MATHSQGNCHRVDGAGEFYAEHGYLKVPRLVQWMATLRCGLKCEHCLAAGDNAHLADMPLEKVKGLIDEAAELGVAEFLLTGGEPLVRQDLPEVIEYLGHKLVSWTLNSAAYPDEVLRKVISRHRPGFVAVSLDGPKDVHNAFRGNAEAYDEAMASIEFYKSLTGVRVCAGTTVTTRNYNCLDETFHIVIGSGADQWGIHLLVPEGRAAQRKDLFLKRAQLKRLIKFVAHKRRYFNVQMADEIGYLGLYEPMVRDIPMRCGAGRSQCVILPDGSVVPCTTLDRSTSAGNIHERSLADIWTHGFSELRNWHPEGRCVQCDYAMACKGGCWLQRKSGTQCFKDVWHIPGTFKTAAGIAICLSGMAVTEATTSAKPSAAINQGLTVVSVMAEDNQTTAPSDPLALDYAIMQYYLDRAAGGQTTVAGWTDPGWVFFSDFVAGTLGQDVTERCGRIQEALQTQQHPLSLAALCWRVIQEPMFEPDFLNEYSDEEKETIRDTLAAIELKAIQWRSEIFEQNLDFYLLTGRRYAHSSPMVKSNSFSVNIRQDTLDLDLAQERWGKGGDPDLPGAAEAYFNEHHYADRMELSIQLYKQSEIIKYSKGESELITSGSGYQLFTMGPFDVIETVEITRLDFEIKASISSKNSSLISESQLLDDQTEEQEITQTISVYLEAGQQYSYVEILNAAHSAQRGLMLSVASDWTIGELTFLWGTSNYIVCSVNQNGALIWPAFREIAVDPTVIAESGGISTRSISLDLYSLQFGAIVKDTDFWMF